MIRWIIGHLMNKFPVQHPLEGWIVFEQRIHRDRLRTLKSPFPRPLLLSIDCLLQTFIFCASECQVNPRHPSVVKRSPAMAIKIIPAENAMRGHLANFSHGPAPGPSDWNSAPCRSTDSQLQQVDACLPVTPRQPLIAAVDQRRRIDGRCCR